ncbi:hypothetical protein ACIQAA_27415 [Neobacillus sp. NPDC093182]|uniref:hypothetical protein n=1 Tax=Neobacillus sp. NPDC093182 TaxID=3364297 RepID=UPI0038134F38
MNYKRLLNSVGKTSFIENYEGYKNLFLKGETLTSEHKKIFANELYDKNRESTSLQAQLTRVNCAINIFKNGWEKEALNDIVLSTSKSVSKEVIEKANKLLNN